MPAAAEPHQIDQMPMDHSALRDLPLDPEPRNFRRQAHGILLSPVLPTPVAAPQLLGWSREVAELLDLPEWPQDPANYAQVLAGNRLTPAMRPFASRYGGHQFGHWAGQLGDGRAITLGETVNRNGQRWELQLKGAGPTPYSRGADGRAVLRSSIREFLCSEAMFHLGVPTTRALSLVLTGDQVLRDMFYDGRAQLEPGAIVCRVAPSFFRIGHLQLPAMHGETEALQALLSHVLARHYPHLLAAPTTAPTTAPSTAPRTAPSTATSTEQLPVDPAVLLAFFDELSQASARLVVHWQRVGFVHGVMNTDNTSLLGLTIDYGPYGWLENYDPDWTPNTTDAQGRRYCFGEQPQVMMWNLAQLAQVLRGLGCEVADLQASLQRYAHTFETEFAAMNLARLGLQPTSEALALVDELWPLLQGAETDMLLWFRGLADLPAVEGNGALLPATEEELLASVLQAFYSPADLEGPHRALVLAWLWRYQRELHRLAVPDTLRRAGMNRLNPLVVPRNWLVQQAIDAAHAGDYTPLGRLLDAFRRPYEVPEDASLYGRRPEWARQRAGCSMLSCSS